MAKPRKPKNDDSKPDNTGAVVRHQKLCLSIDIEKRQIYGYTELEITVPDIGIFGLFAENLGIENVFVDGEPTEFEYYPRQQNGMVECSARRWSWVTDTGSAADAACSAYVSALQREFIPNLLINCCKASFRVSNDPQLQNKHDDQLNLDNGDNGDIGGDDTSNKQNVKLIRINYWVEKAETGIHFSDNLLHTDNQIRRARCWFPCIDEGSQRCCFDLEFTVPHHLVAVSSGNLLYQAFTKDLGVPYTYLMIIVMEVLGENDPPQRTFVYKLDVPVTAQCISLVVAPFEILPDPHVGFISHMCLPANLPKLRNTMEFFHNAFNHYEGYLDAKFPFGSYTQIFLAPEVAVSSSSLGASLSIFSAHVLYDERVIDQVIDTSIKLAFALAKQWFGVYVVPEEPNDEWLLDGLAGFLTDLFVKKFLGNNEARYRRYKANCSVCKADESGATTLSSSTSCKDLYGTHCIGIYGKIRSWKSVAILQMLEKQMGPESFRKILQKVVLRARDTLPVRSLSTKEFRHFATKIGNLERPFLKEFFPRWVGACGCPLLRMGFSYNKRKNIVELAVLRECTAIPDGSTSTLNPDSDNRDGDIGWPGMMSIRVYELDGMYDHPVLPLSGEMWQLLEIQCHSKLAARRFQKPKKGTKPDGSDENGDIVAAADMRSSLESPLLWIRADPEMEYLAAIQFNQPIQMWINQLEKDGDVVAQAQAIAALEALPQLSFSVVNSLNNFLGDSKAFWRVRIEAAFALANTASEESDWSGLLHLVKFYKSRRFDATIGLPKPNDFHDFPEYFVLEAIPQAVAMVRSADKKSPREAIEFVLQLLKYNDNTGNPYSDVFWLSALVQSVGQLEFGQQNVTLLSSILKRIDRLLQFDRLMPSYNGILTISCIRTLVQIAFKLYGSIHLEHVVELIKPFQDPKTIWQIRIEASKALLNLEFHGRGIDAALSLFIRYLKEEPTLRGQAKLAAHAMRLCQTRDGSDPEYDIKSTTLVDLLNLLDGHFAYNNIYLRHYLFCILHILAGRLPTLYGVPRDKMLRLADAETFGEGKNIFAALVPLTKVLEPPADNIKLDNAAIQEAPMTAETVFGNHIQKMDLDCIDDGKELNTISNHHEQTTNSNNHELKTSSTNHEQKTVSTNHEQKTISSDQRTISNDHEQKTVSKDRRTISNDHEQKTVSNDQKTISIDHKQKNILDNHEQKVDSSIQSMQEPFKELDTISISHEHKMPVVKIKVKRSAASSRAEEADYLTVERSRGGHNETDRKPSSSVSVDAPQRNSTEAVSASNQNVEEVNSIIDRGSRMTASIGSAKFGSNGDNFGKELQCTADSSKVLVNPQPEDPSSPGLMQDNNVDAGAQKYASLQTLSIGRFDLDGGSSGAVVPPFRAKEKKKKDKEKKRKREEHKGHKDDPEYLERKRLKKEKKRKEKEMSKLLSDEAKAGSVDLLVKKPEPVINVLSVHSKPSESGGSKIVATNFETKPEPSEGNSAPRFRIKIKSRTLTKS